MTRAVLGESSFQLPNFRHAPAERLLLHAERSIRLIDRLTPLNLSSERARLLAVFESRGVSEPCFQYARPPDFSALQHQLDQLARALERGGPIERLLADRARELTDEAALIAAIGRSRLRHLAQARFRVASLGASEAVCQAWLAEVPEPVPTLRVMSDDVSRPDSLISRLRVWICERNLDVRIELRRELSSVAAAGDGFVAVRPGVPLPAEEAERIALHELEAHVLPRLRARKERIAVFRAGCRGSGEHEEGRALLIEERFGLLTSARRFELAARHRAAQMVRAGAEFGEMVSSLRRFGVTLERAVEYATRVLRGGGLAREIAYVPAYLQLRAAFAERPELERYFERGRVSLQASQILSGRASPGG